MNKKTPILLLICFAAAIFILGCPEKSSGPEATEPEAVDFQSNVDNTFIATVTDDDTVVVSSITLNSGGTAIASGDTVEERLITISGTVPDYLSSKRTATATTSITLDADGGSCMNSGPWNDADTFTIGFQQTISVSWDHQGVMCTGDWGFTITITDIYSDSVMFRRDVAHGIGMNVDQTEGGFDLPPGTYEIHVSTFTGTHTYVNLTYTGGTGGVTGASIVVYHNGNLYPVSEAEEGATYSYVVDLFNGSNTIRVLVIGNFDPAAQADLANIFAASDPIDLTCITDEMAIRVVLTWQLDDSDVDMHLIEPGGYFNYYSDCYYGNRTPNWGDSSSTFDDPILDHDNTSGYGPETTVLPIPQDGLYTVLIYYFGDHGNGPAPTTVAVTLNETASRTFGPRTLVNQEIWIVTGVSVSDGVASFASAPDSSSLMQPASLSRARPKK